MKIKYEIPKLDIEKYRLGLDEKASGLATLYKNLHLNLNVKGFDFIKHRNNVIKSFLRENKLDRIYWNQIRDYITQKTKEIKRQKNGKKIGVKQRILFKNLEGKL
jgi:hypothetical protein